MLCRLLALSWVRMLLVGWMSTGVAFVVFWLLMKVDVHYQVASWIFLGVYWIINFNFNRLWTFGSTGNVRKEAMKHFGLHFGNQFLIMFGLFVLVEWAGVPALLSQLAMQIVTTGVVFWLTPIIFKKK